MKNPKSEESSPIFQGIGRYFAKWLFSWLGLLGMGLFLNALLFGLVFFTAIHEAYHQSSPSKLLDQVEQGLEKQSSIYSSALSLPLELQDTLRQDEVWMFLLDESGKQKASFLTPTSIPTQFSIGEIAQFSKGFLNDYPVFVRPLNQGLLVLGYPKDSFFKFTTNYLPIQVIKQLMWFVPCLFILDALFLFGVYVFSKRQVVQKSEPLIEAIAHLAKGQSFDLKEKGELAPLAQSLNEASKRLHQQNQARANWIVGVSHDIRTPLSLIIGHAQRIKERPSATHFIQDQAKSIQNDAFQIENLIQDLNCVSKLEYDMQPLEKKPILLAKLLRSVVAQVLNTELDESYTIELEIPAATSGLILNGDERLLSRAIFNLLMNAIRHNPQGCQITVGLNQTDKSLRIFVQDNGVGLSKEVLESLGRPHYLQSDENRLDLRHGLGLLLVERITHSHGGNFTLQNRQPGQGVLALLSFPQDLMMEKAI
ncbi:MAG: HAMP domain-containing histidine kinase [Allobaculum sp.]|nr:HAMP domain-containing histidine kinase [Allobaculum sp.]